MAAEVARPREEFFFLSQLLDRPVLSRDGERVGRLVEVGCVAGEPFPRVATYYVRPGWLASVMLAAPAPAFVEVPVGVLRLDIDTSDLKPSARRLPEEILLRREILDKQIVDTEGARVVRVNDVHLLRARGSEVHVVHVDIGFRGILRRLGWERAIDEMIRRAGVPHKPAGEERLLSWRYVVPLRSGALPHDLRLNVAQKQLAQLHPAELAEILEELDRFEGPAMLEALGLPKAAQTLAELSPEIQRLLLEALDGRRAGALLAAMAPDEAADLLEELPEALRERFVATLSAADAATVTDLLSHEPDTAGSVMNPEVFTVAPGTRMGEIKELLRAGPPELVRSYAVLVVGSDSRLRGKVSYVDLIRSRDDAAVDELMDPDPESVRADDPMEDVAELFDRFNLLSLPVVDRDGMLEGVITVDDVVAWLREGEGREGGLT
jgi:CBS domain-containing protein/sporulation protein YlmC with PRC-barrel domain